MKVLWKWDEGCVYNEETAESTVLYCTIFIFIKKSFHQSKNSLLTLM